MEQSDSIGMEIKQLNNMIVHFIEREIPKRLHTPTIMQGRIVGFLYENREKDIFQKDIEKNFSIRRSTVTSILKLMEKRDLIRREEVPYDARLKKLVLTGKAVALQKEFELDIQRVEQKLRLGLTQEEIDMFFAITRKIKKNTLE